MRLLRNPALYVGHLLVALIGTAILAYPLQRMFYCHAVAAMVAREGIFNTVCGVAIGFGMYRTWRWRPAVWVWIVPTIWFAFGVLVVSSSTHKQGSGGGLWYGISGLDCVNGLTSFGCRVSILFTIPFVRSVAYSTGTTLGVRAFGTPASLNGEHAVTSAFPSD